MNTKTKTVVSIVSLVVFIGIAAFAYNQLSDKFKPETPFDIVESQPDDVAEEKEPVVAPDFSAYDNDGNIVKLSDYFGKPIVLNFWASWCPPCKSEMPEFNKVYGEVKHEVVFLMVDMVDGQQETEAKGKKYISDNEFTFPVLFDNDQDAAYTYGIRSIPTTIFVDKDGNVAAGVEGAIDEDTLIKGINLIKNEDTQMKKAEYHKISAEEARKMLDENTDAILLDVRTAEEFASQRIDGAILIPDYELKDRAEAELPDKNALIVLYCRSGNRSKSAANTLVSMGYTNVYDFGGITSYPYETVSD